MRIEVDQRGADRRREDQRAFRTLLDAFSYPGKVVVPAAGRPAHVAVLSTLADTTIPLWIDSGFPEARAVAMAARWPLTNREDAAFALCRGDRLDSLDGFPAGTPADPHLSATIIAEVADLSGGQPLRLSGPGVGPGGRSFAPRGLPDGFLSAWARNNAAYPLGVDLILTAGPLCACLPRSVRLEPFDVRSR